MRLFEGFGGPALVVAALLGPAGRFGGGWALAVAVAVVGAAALAWVGWWRGRRRRKRSRARRGSPGTGTTPRKVLVTWEPSGGSSFLEEIHQREKALEGFLEPRVVGRDEGEDQGR